MSHGNGSCKKGRTGKKYDESLKGKPEKLAWARDAKGKNCFTGGKSETKKVKMKIWY